MSVDTETSEVVQGQVGKIQRYAPRAGHRLANSLRAIVAIVTGKYEEVMNFCNCAVRYSHKGFCAELFMAVIRSLAQRGEMRLANDLAVTVRNHRHHWYGHAIALIAESSRAESDFGTADALIDKVSGLAAQAQGEFDLRLATDRAGNGPIIPDLASIVEIIDQLDAIQRKLPLNCKQFSWYYRFQLEAAVANWLAGVMER